MGERLQYALTVEDYAALNDAIGLRRRFGQPAPWLWYAIGLVNLAVLAYSINARGWGWSSVFSALLAAYAFAAPSLYWMILRRNYHKQGLGKGPVTLQLTKTGVESEQNGISSAVTYPAIASVDDRPKHVLIWISKAQALIVPKRALKNGPGEFIAEIESHRNAVAEAKR